MEKAAKPKVVNTIKHKVTQEDLDNNPDLVTNGIKVGDEIDIPKPANEFDELMKPYKAAYPANKIFFISSDGQVFLENKKLEATEHQSNVDKEVKLVEYKA